MLFEVFASQNKKEELLIISLINLQEGISQKGTHTVSFSRQKTNDENFHKIKNIKHVHSSSWKDTKWLMSLDNSL